MMTRRILLLGFLVVPVACASLFFLLRTRLAMGRESGSDTDAEPGASNPVAQVEIVRIERKSISEKLTTYGSVVAQPGKTRFIATSFESRVHPILVAAGQLVSKGDALLDVQGSPASLLQLHQAELAAQEARKELDQANERFAMKLATNQEFNQAQKAAADAELQLQSLKGQGVTAGNELRSDISGIVAKVDVEDGQIAAAGSPLLELVAADDIEIKLGAEPEDVSRLQPGQRVIISLVNNPTAPGIEGKIRLVAQRINPTDRLVDVFVSVPPGSRLLLGSYVRGEIMVASREGLVVARDAVLPEDGSYTLYVVRENHAEKRQIQIGLQSDSEVEVLCPGLREGDQVATVGNRELADGMEVKEQNIK
jgi:membrane fusion protein (multidrug efflux system)